jgi:hypothetical protein
MPPRWPCAFLRLCPHSILHIVSPLEHVRYGVRDMYAMCASDMGYIIFDALRDHPQQSPNALCNSLSFYFKIHFSSFNTAWPSTDPKRQVVCIDRIRRAPCSRNFQTTLRRGSARAHVTGGTDAFLLPQGPSEQGETLHCHVGVDDNSHEHLKHERMVGNGKAPKPCCVVCLSPGPSPPV